MGRIWKGAADKAEDFAGCKSLCCQLPVFRQLAYSVRVEVTKHVLPGCKSHQLPCGGNRCGRSDQGGKQTVRPEHKEMAAISKTRPAVKSLKRNVTVCRPSFPVGKAAVAEEEPGMCNLPTVVIGAQAS